MRPLREEAAFLDAVGAAPDDDAPRLIYADWLDERGDPRGEFVRVQLALAALPADDPLRPALQDREAALLLRHQAAWTEPLHGLGRGAEFRRGFVEAVNVEARTFLRSADALFRLAPVRHVRFLDVGSSLDRLMDSPFLRRLSAVTVFAQHLDEKLTQALCASPHLDNLKSLNLGRNRVGDRGAERLADSLRFRNLVSLDLGDNAVGDTGIHALAHSTNLANVADLELRRNELSRTALADLCGSRTLGGLKRLGMSLNYIGSPRDWRPPSPGVVALESLDLSENGLNAGGVRLVAEMPGMGSLTRLVLDRNEAGNRGAAALANWSGAASLEDLLLATNRIGDEGATRLARSPYLHRLSRLDLSDNPIHDPGAFAFLNSATLPRLERLGLPYMGLSPQMRRALLARFGG